VLTETVKNAGRPAGLRITPDRTETAADGCDLAFVQVEVIDGAGRVVPTADNLVVFSVAGDGVLAGVYNGGPAGASFR
jgi:beta-galactosidase